MRHEVLRLDHIGRSVNNQIINDISLTLYRQEALCVLTEDIDKKIFFWITFRATYGQIREIFTSTITQNSFLTWNRQGRPESM